MAEKKQIKKPTYWAPKTGERGMNELHFAAYCGDAEGVLAALTQGLDVDGQDDNGYTALHWNADMGCTPGDREAIVTILLDHGAEIEARDAQGRTPLFVAASSGSAQIVRALVLAGADVNARSNSGATPLMLAASSGSLEAVTFLLAGGADANAFTPDGTTAMDMAMGAEFEDVVDVLRVRCEN